MRPIEIEVSPMTKFFLFVLLCALFACQSSESMGEAAYVRKTPGPVLAIATAYQSQSDDSYSFFLELVQSGIELPHSLVKRHTLIVQPYGRFEGVELRAVSEDLRVIILRQTDRECIRHFLLTGNHQQVIDQAMVAQTCIDAANRPPTIYRFRGTAQVQQLEVLMDKVRTDSTEPRSFQLLQTFMWDEEGRIRHAGGVD